MKSPLEDCELCVCDLGSMNEHVLFKFREPIDYLRGKNNPARVNKKCFKEITGEN